MRRRAPGRTAPTSPRPSRAFVLWALLVLAGVAPAPTTAQQTGAQGPGAQQDPGSGQLFFDRVEVQVVNLEVYVTDQQGNPVTGLRREDFELYQDGKPVEITNFYAIESGRPAAEVAMDPAMDAEGTGAEPSPHPELSAAPPPEERRLHLVVYVDQLNISPSSRNRVLEGLELLLEERLTQGDPVMVVSSHPAFEIVQSFTLDRQEVLDAVREVRDRSASSLFVDRRAILNQISTAADTSDPQTFELMRRTTLSSVRQYSANAFQQLRVEVEKLRGLIGSLAGLPGRKAVLHLSDGVPARPGEDLFALWESVFITGGDGLAPGYRGRETESSSYRLTPEIQDLVEEANAHQVTFYTLEAGGQDFGVVDAATRGITSTGERFGGTEVDAVAQANTEASLQQMAGGTGGVPILNANRPWIQLERVAETFDSYYSLGYRPPEVAPGTQRGKYHRIEVKIRRPGLTVRHREGYKEQTTGERVKDATVAALLLGRWSNPMRAYLEVGDATRKQKRKSRYQVPVEVKIPLDRVTLLPGPDSHRGLLRVRVAFQGVDGVGFGVGDELTVPIEIPETDIRRALEQVFTVRVTLTLDPGLHRVAVGVWDEVAAEASFLPYDIVVGEG